ncbi:A24 family peptidase [Sphingomonas sp. 1P06PA]|uniref:prepilin peptidase n=1 Tax=Sphingomonas sp. 1P06PA TaxID=554121 RepID=UPI0039A40E5E
MLPDLIELPRPIASLLGGGAGLIAGSFLATVAIRWPAGRSALAGRSACDGCGRSLRPLELIPLLSWLRARGKCRTCHSLIDSRHPIAELIAAMIGAVALAVAPGWVGIAGALFGWVLLLLAMLDRDHFWLPDRLTLPLAAGGLAVSLAGVGPNPRDSLIGGVAGFAALWLIATLYRLVRRRRGLGGGDPKLMAAIGTWTGWALLPAALLAASLLGLAIVAGLALAGRRVSARTRLPFGALLAPAGFLGWILMARGG